MTSAGSGRRPGGWMVAHAAPRGLPGGRAAYHRRMRQHATTRPEADAPVVAIDAGNSAAKIAPVGAGRVGPVLRLPGPPPDPVALAARIVEVGGPAARVALVSVVPAWTDAVRAACAHAGLSLLVAARETIPLPCALPVTARPGADRLLAAWAARELAGSPVIVADLGTATTVDLVGPDGDFRGGAILPGAGLALGALARAAALLPEVPLAAPERAAGRGTEEAIRAGVLLGQIGAIREIAARQTAELGLRERLPLIATGGITALPWVAELLAAPAGPGLGPVADRVEPELLLRALGALAAAQQPVAA